MEPERGATTQLKWGKLVSVAAIALFLVLQPLSASPSYGQDAIVPAPPSSEQPAQSGPAEQCESGQPVDGQCLDPADPAATPADSCVDGEYIPSSESKSLFDQMDDREACTGPLNNPVDPEAGAMADAGGIAGAVFEAIEVKIIEAFVAAFNAMLDFLLGDGGINPVIDCERSDAEGCEPWFVGQMSLMAMMGLWIMVPLMLVVTIQSIIRGSMFLLTRAFFVMAPAAIFGTIAVAGIAQMLLNISDYFTESILAAIEFGDNRTAIAEGIQELDDDAGGLFGVFFVLVGLLATFVIFIELILREVGIYMSALFLPLCFAGLVWPASAKWAKRLVEILIALIFSKVFIAAAISLGFAAIMGAGEQGEAQQETLGFYTISYTATLLVFAAVIPMKVLSFVPGGSSAMEARASSPGAIWGKGEGIGLGAGKLANWRGKGAASVTPNSNKDFANKGAGGQGNGGNGNGGKGGGKSPWGPPSGKTPTTGDPFGSQAKNSWNAATHGKSGAAPPPPNRGGAGRASANPGGQKYNWGGQSWNFDGATFDSSSEPSPSSGSGSSVDKPSAPPKRPDFARGIGTGNKPRKPGGGTSGGSRRRPV